MTDPRLPRGTVAEWGRWVRMLESPAVWLFWERVGAAVALMIAWEEVTAWGNDAMADVIASAFVDDDAD